MGTMQVVRGIGASISIGDRSYTKTGMEPVVLIPAYKTSNGKVWHYWAVLARSKAAAAGTTNTPQYTVEYDLSVNGRPVYVLTLTSGAYENGTLTISGPGTVPATIQTGAAGQWYDLGSMTADNSALQEAELLLRAAEQKQVAPRTPGGKRKWDHDLYLYFNCFYQGGYGNGPIQQCAATLIGIGDGHNPGFVAHAQSMYNGVADVCGAGMISVAHNDDSGTTLFTALNNIADLFSGAHYAKGQQFRVGNAVMCFFLT